jgi:hypothetical protein
MIKTETVEKYLRRMQTKRIISLVRSKAAEAWLSGDKEQALDQFLSTPTEAFSKSLLESGLTLTQHLFDQHCVQPSLDYAESVQRLSKACYLALPRIHGAFITDEMVDDYLVNSQSDAQHAHNTHIMPYRMLITKPGFEPGPAFVNGYISEGISNHHYIKKKYLSLLTDETLKKALMKDPGRVAALFDKNLDRQDILISMVMDGYEHPILTLGLKAAQESRSPVPALLDYLIANASKYRFIDWVCCVGLIKRHSLADIMRMELTEEQTLALSHAYSSDELMPFVKGRPILKGPLLEESLGL